MQTPSIHFLPLVMSPGRERCKNYNCVTHVYLLVSLDGFRLKGNDMVNQLAQDRSKVQ